MKSDFFYPKKGTTVRTIFIVDADEPELAARLEKGRHAMHAAWKSLWSQLLRRLWFDQSGMRMVIKEDDLTADLDYGRN